MPSLESEARAKLYELKRFIKSQRANGDKSQLNKIEIGKVNLPDVFKNFYIVPDYRRGFVWKQNVLMFLQDINRFLTHVKEEERQ